MLLGIVPMRRLWSFITTDSKNLAANSKNSSHTQWWFDSNHELFLVTSSPAPSFASHLVIYKYPQSDWSDGSGAWKLLHSSYQ